MFCQLAVNEVSEPFTILGRRHYEGDRIISSSLRIFREIKVPAGSDFKVTSPNFKFLRRKTCSSGGVCSTTLCMSPWFSSLLPDCCLLEWMEALEFTKRQGQWWDFLDVGRHWCSAGPKSSVEVLRPRAKTGGQRSDRGTWSEGKEGGSRRILGVEEWNPRSFLTGARNQNPESFITSCQKHAGGRKELMERLHRSTFHCKNVEGIMRPEMFMKWGIKSEIRSEGEKLQKCSTAVVQEQSAERARAGIQRKLRCLWTMASRYLVGVERRWKSDDGSVCEQLLFPSRAACAAFLLTCGGNHVLLFIIILSLKPRSSNLLRC